MDSFEKRFIKKERGNSGPRLCNGPFDLSMSEERICSLQGICGGCVHIGTTYEEQLAQKNEDVRAQLTAAASAPFDYEGILRSPLIYAYRNKMEYSFGDEQKNGPLTLGLHKKRSFYDVVDADCCQLVHEDFNVIVRATRKFFGELGLTYTDKRSHRGYLRHLLIRRAVHTGELLVDLVTTSQPLIPVMGHSFINDLSLYETCGTELVPEVAGQGGMLESAGQQRAENFNENTEGQTARNLQAQALATKKRRRGGRMTFPALPAGSVRAAQGVQVYPEKETLDAWRDLLLELAAQGNISGKLCGILHTINDSPSDAIKNDRTDVLCGSDFINETLLGLSFKITPFSFFQTNSGGAEVLYEKARSYVSGALHKSDTVYDLYSGTGTIAQMLAPCVKNVIGVEIIPEAVEAARQNAARNGLSNCSFLAGDVLKVLDEIQEKPDVIILDPPRDGVNPKALTKILAYGVETIVYVSCKCQSLCRDLAALEQAGYRLMKAAAVDQFPHTAHCEVVSIFQRND